MKTLEKIKRSVFWSSVAKLTSGQIVAQAVNVLSIPLISRIYSKQAYADFGIVTSTAIIIMGFIGLGLGSAIMAADTKEESERVLRSCVVLQFILSSVICIIMLLLEARLKLYETQLPYLGAVLIMYVYLNLSVHVSLMNVYVNRCGSDRVLMANPMFGAMCSLLVTLPLGLLGFDSIGLFVANILSLTLMNIHMLRHHNPYKERFCIADIKYVFQKYWHFVVYQYPSNLVGTFTIQLPTQVINATFERHNLGDYSMVNRVFGVPSSLIVTPIQTVYFRVASERVREGKEIGSLTYSLVTKVLLFAALPLIVGVVFAEEIFSFVLGGPWRTAGSIASFLAFPFLFSFCYNCVTYCRVIIKKQKVNLVVTLLHIVSTISALALGAFVFRDFTATIICFAVSETLYSVFNLCVNFYCLGQYLRQFLIFCLTYLVGTLGISYIISALI